MSDLVRELGAREWQKDWEGNFSLLNCISCEPYFHECQDMLGARTERILVFHTEGITSCLLGKRETREFAQALARRVAEEPSLPAAWADGTAREYAQLQRFIALPPETLASSDEFSAFMGVVRRYSVYMIAMKAVINALPPDTLERHAATFVEARKATEKFYFRVEDVLEALAARLGAKEGLPTHLVESVRPEELLLYLNGAPLPPRDLLESRYRKSAFLYEEKATEFSSEDAEELERLVYREEGKELAGTSAHRGTARGTARVITDFAKEKDSFVPGEVLVTGMTDPHYLPLMKQAAAIVTDAGGLLCHAAIAARELGIPCVIGTERATKLFSTGDLIEVDADNGLVRKV